jgi:hypothetical protein
MLNIGVAGCSHSGGGYGHAWTHYMSHKLECKLTDVTAPGVGNEMMIEKIKRTLETKIEHDKVDFYIYQIIEPSRLVLGLNGNDPEDEYRKYQTGLIYNQNNINCHRQTNGISYFTFQQSLSNDDVNKLINKNYDFANFIRNHILISDFNVKIKVFHTLMAIQNLFNFYNKKVFFFSWAVNIKELAKEVGYEDILNSMYIMDGNVETFAKNRELKTVSDTDFHYGSESQRIIYEDFLHNNIVDFINNKL